MNGSPPGGHPPAVYELRILGLIPEDVREALGDVVTESASVSTVLSRAFTDQAQLLGFVTRLRALGLEVLEVQRLHAEIEPDQPPG